MGQLPPSHQTPLFARGDNRKTLSYARPFNLAGCIGYNQAAWIPQVQILGRRGLTMPGHIEDRFGMTLSTSSVAAAERWQEGVDRLLSQNHGPELKFQEAIDLDEGFAIAHGCLAFWYQQRARPEDARQTVEKALALSPGITRRER